MESFIVAARNDGFGERMCAMLNAMYIAKKTGWTFKFIWQDPPKLENNDQNVLLPWNDMLPQDLMFSKNFISQHATKDIPQDNNSLLINYKTFQEAIQNPHYYGWGKGHYSCQSYFSGHRGLYTDIDTQEYAKTLQECWNEIEFTPNIQHIITQAKCHKNLPTNFTAIHIRCGDVLLHNNEYIFRHKTANIYLIIEIIKREIREDNSIILFSDDLSVLQNIKEQFSSTNKVFIIDDFFERTQHTRLEQSIFEIMIMSQAKKLYSGISGFSRLANMIGNNQHIIIYDLFNTQEQYDIISKHIQQYELPAIHKAFSYMYLFSLAQSLKMSPHTQKTYIQEAITLNQNSLTYKILFVYVLLLNKDLVNANEQLKAIYCHHESDFFEKVFKPLWLNDSLVYSFTLKSYFIDPKLYQLYPYIAYFAHTIALKLQIPSIRKCLLNRDYKTYFYITRYLINSNNSKVLSDAIMQLNKKSTLNITTTRNSLLMLYIKVFFSAKLKKFKKSCQKRAKTIKEQFNLPSK